MTNLYELSDMVERLHQEASTAQSKKEKTQDQIRSLLARDDEARQNLLHGTEWMFYDVTSYDQDDRFPFCLEPVEAYFDVDLGVRVSLFGSNDEDSVGCLRIDGVIRMYLQDEYALEAVRKRYELRFRAGSEALLKEEMDLARDYANSLEAFAYVLYPLIEMRKKRRRKKE